MINILRAWLTCSRKLLASAQKRMRKHHNVTSLELLLIHKMLLYSTVMRRYQTNLGALIKDITWPRGDMKFLFEC